MGVFFKDSLANVTRVWLIDDKMRGDSYTRFSKKDVTRTQ